MKILASFLPVLIALGLLFHKEPESSPKVIKNAFEPVKEELKTGDIVLRAGKGFISDMFRKTSMHQSKFSHAGLLVIENETAYVFHMMGNPDKKLDGLRKEKLSTFCNSNENSGYAVYRYNSLAGSEEKIEGYLQELIELNPVFDDAFDLSTENALYCTEMIYKSLITSSGTQLPITSIEGKNYVGLDDLYLNPESIKITEVFYQ